MLQKCYDCIGRWSTSSGEVSGTDIPHQAKYSISDQQDQGAHRSHAYITLPIPRTRRQAGSWKLGSRAHVGKLQAAANQPP